MWPPYFHLILNFNLPGHACWLQGWLVVSSPQGMPPCRGWVRMVLVSLCSPPPQVAEQLPSAFHSLCWQSTGGRGWEGDRGWDLYGGMHYAWVPSMSEKKILGKGSAEKAAFLWGFPYIEVQDQVKIGRPHEQNFCHATLKLIKNV